VLGQEVPDSSVVQANSPKSAVEVIELAGMFIVEKVFEGLNAFVGKGKQVEGLVELFVANWHRFLLSVQAKGPGWCLRCRSDVDVEASAAMVWTVLRKLDIE
jgi:hypothetical protein